MRNLDQQNQSQGDEFLTVISEVQCLFGEHPVSYQKWVSDGVTGESLIFSDDTDLPDTKTLIQQMRESGLVREDSQVTTAQRVGRLFVNFNFQ